ncbi:MAG: thioesterase, partial [Candidatus Promineifilaceae bacterium]
QLLCRAEVLKPGRTITIVESTVEAVTGDKRTLVSKATVTIANMIGT